MRASDSRASRLGRICAVGACLFLEGWGPEGHEIVAGIAAREITLAASRQVAALLDGPAAARMPALASWADWQGRKRPETKPWHYVDVPIEAAAYDAARDCPNGDCIVAALARETAVLGDVTQPPAARAEALLWVIHLVGDLHQPLHCADHDDRGGNGVPVAIGEYDTNLHRVWDSDEVAQLGLEPDALAARLDRQIRARDKARWRRGTPADWANESHAIARRIYARLPAADDEGVVHLTPARLRADSGVAAVQLERGGIRLADILNRALR